MKPPQKTFRIGVYGSLRQGHYNHVLLEGVPCLGEVRVPKMDLYSLGPYPAAIPGEGDLLVELYDVPPAIFWRLQDMELNAGYRESLVFVDGETTFIIWIYIGRLSEEWKIPSGDWNDHLHKS